MELKKITRFTSLMLIEGVLLYVFYHLSLFAWAAII